jgi:hypothetical protein
MKPNLTDRIIGYIIFMLALVLLLMSAPMWASDDCKGNKPCGSTDVDVANEIVTGDVIGGDTSVSNSSRALALSNALGDVDIAGCLGSTQWATPLFSKQKLVVNWPCLTEFYLRNGQYDLASMAICNTEVRQEFATEQECRDAHDFEVMVEEAVIVMESSEEEEEFHQEQMMIQQEYEERIEQLERSKRVVVQQPYLSDEKKQKLREIVNE